MALARAGILVLTVLWMSHTASGEAPYSTDWTQQFGTSSEDRAFAVGTDHLGNVFVAGRTRGAMEGMNAGGNDAYFGKFDSSGSLQWTRQFGSAFGDQAESISIDSTGNIFISGTTEKLQNGFSDAFLNKYDSAGMPLWTRQYQISIYDHRLTRVSTDELGNAYVAGSASSHFQFPSSHFRYSGYIRKYDALGESEWTQPIGVTPFETYSGDVSIDGLGNIYVTGSTYGTLDVEHPNPNSFASDAFLSRYDASGNLQWIRQYGTVDWETSNGVAADTFGNIYITGYRQSTSSLFDRDIFLIKYDSSGQIEWLREFGTPSADDSNAIAVDGIGNVYITGFASGSLASEYAGAADAFLRKYDPQGNILWTRQFGTITNDASNDVSTDANGNIYTSGFVNGSITHEPDSSGADAWVSKFVPPLPGDYNGNDVVDAADYIVWRKSGGTPDAYNTWRANFGRTLGGEGTLDGATVPEPCSCLLVFLTIFVQVIRSRAPDRGNSFKPSATQVVAAH